MELFTYFEYFGQYIIFYVCEGGGGGEFERQQQVVRHVFHVKATIELFATIATTKRQANNRGNWVILCIIHLQVGNNKTQKRKNMRKARRPP